MGPYRTNQAAPVVPADPTIKVLTKKIFDVEVAFVYQNGDKIVTTHKMFCGDQELDKVDAGRYDAPKAYSITCGVTHYHNTMNVAAEKNRLWVNNDLCVPWHHVVQTKIVKRIPRTFNWRYTLKGEMG